MPQASASRIRVAEPNRSQVVIRYECLDDLLPAEHPARVFWDFTGTIDLSLFLVDVKTVQGRPGRTPVSPRVLLTLWLYATSQGISSAHEIARRIQSEDAFRWIVGGISVSHDILSDFRAEQGPAFEQLLTDILAALMHQQVLSLDVVAQDGLRVRASASSPSFRSAESLQACREQAELHLRAIRAQADDPERSPAQRRARERCARDYQRRIEDAIVTVGELQKKRKPSDKPARASTTDAQARVMKMADGGFRPAYNVRLATAGAPEGGRRTVVGVQVVNVGSDMGAVIPMLDQVQRRTGQLPKTLMADANHALHDDIREATRRGVEVLIAVPEPSKQPGPQADKDEAIVEWRERMESSYGRECYRGRASLSELANAQLRSRQGLQQFLVRGITKVTNVVLLGAIAFNVLQHSSTLLG